MAERKAGALVLVADDEEPIRGLCRRLLEAEGYRVVTARDGLEAIERFRKGSVDAVITDVKMPGASGIEVLRFIRERSLDTPVILITGFASLDLALEALRLGANELLVKPVQSGGLIPLAVERGLQWRKLLRRVQSLEHLNAEKDAFISIVGHELRTPLTVLHGALASLDADGAADRELVAMCRRAGSRLGQAVEDMLLLRGLLAGDIAVQRRPQPVSALVEESLGEVRELAREHEVSLDAEVEPADMKAPLDPVAMRSALVQLLRNAIVFNRAGGFARLKAERAADELVLEVRDNGQGIPAGLQAIIFERFAQGADHMTREVGGLGLGLAIVRAVVRHHEGSVQVESRAGEGSHFIVRLPLGTVQAARP